MRSSDRLTINRAQKLGRDKSNPQEFCDLLADIWYAGSARIRREVKAIMAAYHFAAPDYREEGK